MNKAFFIVLLSALFLTGCRSAVRTSNPHPMTEAYRHVLDHWQSVESGDKRRGYNIGAVLVDSNGVILSRELNSVIETQDCTQHAEMRLIQNYISKHRCFNLNNCIVYTTLEPCAMCAAAMGMAGIKQVYYGQSDPEFGKAAERLSFDSSQLDGYKPYPRVVQCELLRSPMQEALEKGFRQSGIKEITKWLATADAKHIFAEYCNQETNIP